jgi:hypothetical protein
VSQSLAKHRQGTNYRTVRNSVSTCSGAPHRCALASPVVTVDTISACHLMRIAADQGTRSEGGEDLRCCCGDFHCGGGRHCVSDAEGRGAGEEAAASWVVKSGEEERTKFIFLCY